MRTMGICNIMATQTTISKKQENKGARGILDLTSTLGQVLKQFIGIYGKQLPDCDGLTVENWMDAHGVHRFVGKGGKKGNYTPALLMNGWNDGMKRTNKKGEVVQSCVFKAVPAKIMIDDPNDPDGKSYRVFTKEEAEKVDGKPISRYMLVGIEDNRWSVSTILRGLRQSNDFAKEEAKRIVSDSTWENLKHVYIVRYVKAKNAKTGEEVTMRKVVEVDKLSVTF